jgi:hypothetical protein
MSGAISLEERQKLAKTAEYKAWAAKRNKLLFQYQLKIIDLLQNNREKLKPKRYMEFSTNIGNTGLVKGTRSGKATEFEVSTQMHQDGTIVGKYLDTLADSPQGALSFSARLDRPIIASIARPGKSKVNGVDITPFNSA